MDIEREMVLIVVPDGWDVTVYGDLIAPCGDTIKQDGECSCGEHVSPLRLLGLI
jgi:hypothetical protein